MNSKKIDLGGTFLEKIMGSIRSGTRRDARVIGLQQQQQFGCFVIAIRICFTIGIRRCIAFGVRICFSGLSSI
jgi:hypothetical protein